jgi:formylglycine-generating enzyme required for sulfatase activity
LTDVFISYARAERAEAEVIKARLEALGLSVFLDVEGLDGGDVFSDVLDREVKNAAVVLGLWSPPALSRPWVQIECDIGKRRGVLVPVAIKPFTDMQTPATFWNIQFVDLTELSDSPDDPAWRKLIKSIERTLKRPALIPPLPPDQHLRQEAATQKVAERSTRPLMSARPDALPRADAAVFYTLARAALNRETIDIPLLISEASRLSRKPGLNEAWLDVSFNRILRVLLQAAQERGEVIPFIAAIAVDPKTHLPPASIDSAARAWIERSYAAADAQERQAEFAADRIRAVARLQNPVFAYADWVELMPYVGIPPDRAETWLAGDAALESGPAQFIDPPKIETAKVSQPRPGGGNIVRSATIGVLVVGLLGAGLWFIDPLHWRGPPIEYSSDTSPTAAASQAPSEAGQSPAPEVAGASPQSPTPSASPTAVPSQVSRQAGETFRDCPGCPEMVAIPLGSFTMGSPPNEAGRDPAETQHAVKIANAFAAGKYDVTWDDWEACVAAGGCVVPEDDGFGKGRRPVTNVSWTDAKAYLRWLNGKVLGAPYRLLSEAEWEYAARAGAKKAYPWGDSLGVGNAVCSACGSEWDRRSTAPVGSFKPNAFGLYDMHGNAWQWVEDCYEKYGSGQPTDGSAFKTTSCSLRVIRGGSWYYDERLLRSAARTGYEPSNRNHDVGFRLGRTLF